MLEKNARCVMCGTAPWEWDPDQGGHRFAYEAVESTCQGCLRKAAASEAAGSSPGVNVILIPTNTVEYARHQRRASERWMQDMVRKAGKGK